MNKTNIKKKIMAFSNDNMEPDWVIQERLDALKKIDDYTHPSFGPEIKLDINFADYCNYKAVPFHIEGDGFIACDIHTAFKKYQGLIDKYFGYLIFNDENRYTNLNSILFQTGYFIYVFKGKKINYPIFNKNTNCAFCKNLIIIDENAELNIIDYASSHESLKCESTEIYVEENAKCRYLNLNMRNDSKVVSLKRANIKDSGCMEWINVITDSKIYMGYPSSILEGKKAISLSTTLVKAKLKNSINVGTRMIHIGSNTRSIIDNVCNNATNSEIEVRNLVHINESADNSHSVVKYEYNSTGNNSKYDNTPKYIVENDSSTVNFKVKNGEVKDIMEFIDDHFISLNKQNKKMLQQLIKGDI